MTITNARRAVPAGATPLPSRRSIMRSIASLLPVACVGAPVVASAAPLALVAPALVPALAPVIREESAIMAIGAQIGRMVAAYRSADAARLEARDWAERLSPRTPPDLILPPGHPWRQACGEEVRDAEGNRPEPQTYVAADGKRYARMPVKVLNSKITRAYLQQHGLKHEGPRLRRLIARAEKYERQRLTAIQVSGIRAAVDRLEAVRWDINHLAHEAAKLEPRTWAGVAIFARLAILPDELGDDVMGWKHAMRVLLTTALARAVLTVSQYAQEGVA